MKTHRALLIQILGVFAIIFIVIGIYSFFESTYNEIPRIEFNRLTNGNSFFDKPSPGNWIKGNQIFVYEDRIIILVPNATISTYAPTKSMDPTLDAGANGIEIVPQGPEQIHVGDIIAYKPDINGDDLIVHRVIKIGIDDQGWYCITKGDNTIQDDGKIRFEQIKYVTIAILY